MLRVVREQEKKNDIPSQVRIQFADDSLSPDAMSGDFALVAPYIAPQDDNLVVYQYRGKHCARWWRLVGDKVVLSDAENNEETLPLADVLVIGVVVEIRRPLLHGRQCSQLIALISALCAPIFSL
jgi:hypothetical protein